MREGAAPGGEMTVQPGLIGLGLAGLVSYPHR